LVAAAPAARPELARVLCEPLAPCEPLTLCEPPARAPPELVLASATPITIAHPRTTDTATSRRRSTRLRCARSARRALDSSESIEI
jgi:hypothetical protein